LNDTPVIPAKAGIHTQFLLSQKIGQLSNTNIFFGRFILQGILYGISYKTLATHDFRILTDTNF